MQKCVTYFNEREVHKNTGYQFEYQQKIKRHSPINEFNRLGSLVLYICISIYTQKTELTCKI